MQYTVYQYQFIDNSDGNVVIKQNNNNMVLSRCQLAKFIGELEWFSERMDENVRRWEVENVLNEIKKGGKQ